MLYGIEHKFVIQHVLLLYLLILFSNLFYLDLQLIGSYDVRYLGRFISLLMICQNMHLLVLRVDARPFTLKHGHHLFYMLHIKLNNTHYNTVPVSIHV